jgi:hypothetical protein
MYVACLFNGIILSEFGNHCAGIFIAVYSVRTCKRRVVIAVPHLSTHYQILESKGFVAGQCQRFAENFHHRAAYSFDIEVE